MLLVRPIAGVVSDRIGRRPLMIGGALGIAVFQLLHIAAAETGELWVLLLVRIGTGGFSSLMYLAQATTATELPSEEHRAKVFSTFSVAVFVAFMGCNAFIQPYSEEFGIEEARWLLLTYSGTTLVMRFAGGWVLDRFDRRNLATFAHSTVAIGALVLATASGAGQLYFGAFVIAIGMAWNVPLLMLIAVDSATDHDRSRVVATVTTFGDLANSAGALMLGCGCRRGRLRRDVCRRGWCRCPRGRIDAEQFHCLRPRATASASAERIGR
jgi:MFS family permease